jgi:hypothetical protein
VATPGKEKPEPQPLTGFTLELDGEPDVIQRVYKAVEKAMQAEIDSTLPDYDYGHGLRPPIYIRSTMPFTGKITLRSPAYPNNKTTEERIEELEQRIDTLNERIYTAVNIMGRR